MARLRGACGLLTLWLAVPGAAHAAASLQCSRAPVRPVLGDPLRWTIVAVNLPALPPLPPQSVHRDWRVWRQTMQREVDAAGRSRQLVQLTLYPRAAGTLELPAVRAGALSCRRTAVRVAAAMPGQAAPSIALRVDAAQRVVGQAVRVELDLGQGGALDWHALRLASDDGLLRELPPRTRELERGARRVSVQRQSWSYTPLHAGVATLRPGWLRATRFGQLLLYPLAPLTLTVRALPAYWPEGAAVGHARLRTEAAPRRLQRGARGVLRATLSGVRLGRAALRELTGQARTADPALRFDPARLRRSFDADRALTPVWHIELPFRVLAAGLVAYPQLRVPYYDPQRGAPGLAVADWGEVRLLDPRPQRLLAAATAVGALVGLLALLRLGALALRAGCCRRRWQRLAARGDSDALWRAWQRDLALAAGTAPTLRSWLRSQRCGGHPLSSAALERLLVITEGQRYGGRAALSDVAASDG